MFHSFLTTLDTSEDYTILSHNKLTPEAMDGAYTLMAIIEQAGAYYEIFGHFVCSTGDDSNPYSDITIAVAMVNSLHPNGDIEDSATATNTYLTLSMDQIYAVLAYSATAPDDFIPPAA